MKPSKVFYTDLHATSEMNLLQKFARLIKEAGIGTIDFDNKFTAIKVHFGEPGNLAYLRPHYAKVVADQVKELGGKPFVTDCNTLYVGGRKNALDHLDSAYVNGYNPFQTGVQTIIADGLKGTEERYLPVPGGEYIKEAKIGSAIADADIVLSLNHFKGHELTGFGGALKNIGMGAGSRAGKMEMHSAGKPYVTEELCIGCGRCRKNCQVDAPQIFKGKATIDHAVCVGCGRCIGVCPTDAITPAQDEANDILNRKIAEYTHAVLLDKPHFHMSLVIDVSPYCDCHSENDIPIVPDVGMCASFDPVALDIACADAVNAQPAVPGSKLERADRLAHADHFHRIFPETDWKSCIDQAVKLGIGQREYERVDLKLT